MKAIFLSLIAVSLPFLSLSQDFPVNGWPANQHDANGLVAFYKATARDKRINSTRLKKDTIKWLQAATYNKSLTLRKPAPRHFRAQSRSEMTRIAAQTGRTTLMSVSYQKNGTDRGASYRNATTGNGISIYPDPGREIAALDLKPDEVFKVVISDLSGNELLRQANPCSIDFSQFYKGVYLLEIMTSKGFSRMRVIKR